MTWSIVRSNWEVTISCSHNLHIFSCINRLQVPFTCTHQNEKKTICNNNPLLVHQCKLDKHNIIKNSNSADNREFQCYLSRSPWSGNNISKSLCLDCNHAIILHSSDATLLHWISSDLSDGIDHSMPTKPPCNMCKCPYKTTIFPRNS